MSSSLTTSTVSTTPTAAVPAQRQPGRRRPSRRTAWLAAGGAFVVLASTATGAIVLTSSDAASVPLVNTNWSPRADAAESSHGQGPVAPAAEFPVRRGPDAAQLVHGTRGALSDAAGRPLHS